jgi:hypothetical protein
MAPHANNPSSPSLYKYVNIAGLKRILFGSIRVTQPSAFNDPDELLPEVIIPADEPEKPLSIAFDIGAASTFYRRHRCDVAPAIRCHETSSSS